MAIALVPGFAIPVPVPAAPLPDSVYLQEVAHSAASATPLTAVGLDGEQVFAATEKGLVRLDGDSLIESTELRGPVHRLVRVAGSLWAMTGDGLHRRKSGVWTQLSRDVVTDICLHQGQIIAATAQRLWRVEEDSMSPLNTTNAPFGISRVTSHYETLFLLGPGRLTTFNDGIFGGLDVYGFPADQVWDWGTLPSLATRDLLSVGNKLVIATDRGLGVLRGMSLATVAEEQGLPVEDVRCLTSGFTNDLWIGTSRGAVREVGGAFHYFAGKRWLPADRVNGIAVDAERRAVYLATDGGLAVLRYVPFTLEQKAAYYEHHLEHAGQKRLGFVHKLEWNHDTREYVREVSDNDGGYSGDYLAALAYRYAITGNPAARREATNTFHTLRWLESVTGIPGFPARSIWVKGEKGHKSMGGSGGYPAEWHDAADSRFEWKGDTSSDELCSHFYAVAIFLDLAAQGQEREQARRHLGRIARHLIEHQWQLVDLDGKPTRWGRWDPQYFESEEGRFDSGLQSLEILSFMKTAEVLVGDPTCASAYQRLVEMGYPELVLRQRRTFPPEAVLHFEDQLAFWSYWNLLQLEKDPRLRSLYRRSFERTYEVLRVEQQPWFNWVHRVFSGSSEESPASLTHLRDWPLDLRIWSYRNSHRRDLRTPSGYVAIKGVPGAKAISPREREPMRWDSWTMQMDGGNDGRDVVEPSAWLLAYWMARYYGFLAAPEESPGPVSLESVFRTYSAEPYQGPPRPPVD